MLRINRPAAVLLLAALLLTLCGCSAGNIDQYFSLPQPAEEYRQLQELIDGEIAAGSVYSAPTRGSFRQSVRLYDINGDGTDEAMAFFRGSDGTLKIVIYLLSGSEYRPILTLKEEGRSIGRVSFADIDDDGHPDLIVAWEISSGMSILSVYSMLNWSGERLMSTDCTEFVTGDITNDGRDELLALRSGGSGSYLADMYTIDTNGEPMASTAALSAGIDSPSPASMIRIGGGKPALLVESSLRGGDAVSDLIVFRDGALVNLTMNRGSGISDTRRTDNGVSAQDIDGDGLTEIPFPQQLYSPGGETHWSTAWYRYDISGRAAHVLTTYHSVADHWYFVLPDGWEVGLTARVDDSIPGERKVILSRLRVDGSLNDLLAVCSISGENREDRAATAGRFLLEENSSVTYAAELYTDELDRDAVLERFHLIFTEWGAGSF